MIANNLLTNNGTFGLLVLIYTKQGYNKYMKNDSLVSIIGDPLRAKILRLFVMHQIDQFTVVNISSALRVPSVKVSRVLRTLIKDTIVKQKVITMRIAKKVKGKEKKVVKKEKGYCYNKSCKFHSALEALILHTIPSENEALVNKLSKLKGLKVLVTTGVFSRNPDATADILIVGNDIDESEIVKTLRSVEKMLGFEFRYMVLSTNDFVHKLNTSDRSIRGVLDYPYQVHIDRQSILENCRWL